MQQHQVVKGLLYLTVSSFLFASMGVIIRYVAHTYQVDNVTIVFFRNFFGLLCFSPLFFTQGASYFKTDKLWMHAWRALIGLTAMYGFFYAIAHIKLSNAMVFTYSSPVFIPLVAYLFLKEPMNKRMWLAALVGLIGVLFVTSPQLSDFNQFSVIGIVASFCAAMAFVTVRALTITEPAARIVFYFCFIATLVSVVPMIWYWQYYSLQEWLCFMAIGMLAAISQVFLSNAYKFAPAGQIGPANYLAIIFAGIYAYFLWGEKPTIYDLVGLLAIFVALILCLPQQYYPAFMQKLWAKLHL